jgi:hypothetical protein
VKGLIPKDKEMKNEFEVGQKAFVLMIDIPIVVCAKPCCLLIQKNNTF